MNFTRKIIRFRNFASFYLDFTPDQANCQFTALLGLSGKAKPIPYIKHKDSKTVHKVHLQIRNFYYNDMF